MKKITILSLPAWILLSLSAGCSSVTTKTPEAAESQAPPVIMASGYSQVKNLPQYTQLQNRYVIEQSAKLNAYRELAKKLNFESLSNKLRVADQIIKDEAFRIYVDLFLREAKVIESTTLADHHKIVLELNLTDRFYQCTSNTVATVSQCLREDNKIPFTRIGYQQAALSTVNISCVASNCSNQLHISGFSKNKHMLDRALLDFGFYDAGWAINSGLRTALRYFVVTGMIFN